MEKLLLLAAISLVSLQSIHGQGDSQPAATSSLASLKVYNNYDFTPGDKILFEDHFDEDRDGEFASHWELKSGQAVLNKVGEDLAMHLTDGNYAVVAPRMKTEKYLPDQYTIEYDYYHVPQAAPVVLQLKGYDKQQGFDRESPLTIGEKDVSFSATAGGVMLAREYSTDLAGGFDNKWHHIAIAVKGHQIKVYVDQFRVLVIPDNKEEYQSFSVAGIGDEHLPIVFRNFRIAAGGGMNMIGKKFTDAKIVTHGINFDYNKAIIRPESMGTLNMIVQVMKDNPELRFEVGGHTDSDGTANYNLTLSQQRAEAVRAQLIKMGVDAGRLNAKGYGAGKPISDNNTPEGKANNRRVEFVRL
jgi:outer membrane protein OmpA-like peptidoglycan-associated protein